MIQSLPRSINFSDLDRWDVKYFSVRIKSKYPLVSLKTFVSEHNEKVRPFKAPEETFKILGVNNTDGIFHAYNALGKEIKQPYKKVSASDFAYNPYRINVGSIGWVPDEHDGAYISPAYVVFSINDEVILPELFWFILKSDFFNKSLRAATAGSVRMNLTFPLLETLKVPIPPLEIQRKIVLYWRSIQDTVSKSAQTSIEVNKEIESTFLKTLGLLAPKKTIQSKCFVSNWEVFDRWSVSYNQTILSMIDLTRGKYPVVGLGSILDLVQYGTSEKANNKGNGFPILRMNNIKNGVIEYSNLKSVKLNQDSFDGLKLIDGDILIIRTNGSKDLVGTCAVFNETSDFVFASYLIRLRTNQEVAKPDYVAWYINSSVGRQQIDQLSRQIMQCNINSQEIRCIRIPLPPIEVQSNIMKQVEATRLKRISMEESAALIGIKGKKNIEKLILGTLSIDKI